MRPPPFFRPNWPGATTPWRPASRPTPYQSTNHSPNTRPPCGRRPSASLKRKWNWPGWKAETRRPPYADACAAWLEVVRYEGFSTRVRRHLAECKLGQGDSLGAAYEWEQVVEAEPDDTFFWTLLAPAHLAREEWDAAARAYRALAQAEPGNLKYRFFAGLLNLATDPSQARQDLLAARDDPRYLKRVDVLLAATEAGELDPGRLGLVYLSVGEPGLALSYLQAAGREHDNATIWAYLGLAQDQLGHNGYSALARALELDPESPVAHSLMGNHWWQLGRPDLARPEYVNAWQLDPDSPAHLVDVAAAYEAEGDTATAEAWYQAAVRRAPDNADFWILLSRFYLNNPRGEADNSLIAAQKAVALTPDNPSALDALGWAQLQGGRPGPGGDQFAGGAAKSAGRPGRPLPPGRAVPANG